MLRVGLRGSLRGRRVGRRMFAFRVWQVVVVCAVFAAAVGAIVPSPRVPAGRISGLLKISVGRQTYAIATSWKGMLLRHMACSITASFRVSATFALRGPVRSAITWTNPAAVGPQVSAEDHVRSFEQEFLVNPSPRFETPTFRLTSPDS